MIHAGKAGPYLLVHTMICFGMIVVADEAHDSACWVRSTRPPVLVHLLQVARSAVSSDAAQCRHHCSMPQSQPSIQCMPAVDELPRGDNLRCASPKGSRRDVSLSFSSMS